SELASAGDGGMHIWLDRVPLRAKGMTPAEILSSESQERMCAVVQPSDVDAFMAVCAKWDVIATEIGAVTGGDRLVLTWHGGTVLAQPSDAGMIRIDERTGRGVALSCDCNGRFVRLDPYAGTQLALAEAYRNVAASGARPVAVTNCLNFGSPEDPGVMWQF